MMGSILLITVSSLLYLVGLTDAQTLHVCTSPVGQQCNLDCETPDQSVPVLFTDPRSNIAGSCNAVGTCLSGITGYSVARVNSTFTRLTIATLSYTRDYGNWKCSHGVTESTTVPVPCPSPSPNITVTVDGNNITSTAKCQFPVSAYTNLSLEYTDQKGNVKTVVSNASPVSVNVTTDGCESHETNVILTQPKPDDICGNINFKSTFVNIYLGTITGSLSFENEGSADCVISTSDSPSITDQSTNMHATEQSSLANTGDVVSTTVKSTTVPPTTKPLLSEEEVLILAVSLSVGVFMIITIIIIVVFLFRNNKKGQTNKKHYKDKNNRSTGKQRADENELKHTKYHGEGISHKKHPSDVGHHTSTSAKSSPQHSNKHNYNFYQPQILHGHNYGFQEGQSPYTEDNWDNFDYFYGNRAYSGSKAHGRYPHDNDHHGYTRHQSYPNRYPHDNDRHGYTRNQSYPNRSDQNLYPSLHQSYAFY